MQTHRPGPINICNANMPRLYRTNHCGRPALSQHKMRARLGGGRKSKVAGNILGIPCARWLDSFPRLSSDELVEDICMYIRRPPLLPRLKRLSQETKRICTARSPRFERFSFHFCTSSWKNSGMVPAPATHVYMHPCQHSSLYVCINAFELYACT